MSQTTMKPPRLSTRAAAGTMGVAALSSVTAASLACAEEAAEAEAPAAPAYEGTYDIMCQYTTHGHGMNPEGCAP